MSDGTLNRFLSQGTAAEMAAFTPNPATPASGPDFLNLWRNTDDGFIYYWDGAAWQIAVAGGGTVTNTGTLTDKALVVGNGGVDVSAIAVGANDEVLLGATAADPVWGKVTESHMNLSDVTTLDASTTKHGFLKKLPNDATKFLDGTGTFSTVTSTPPSLKVLQQERFI